MILELLMSAATSLAPSDRTALENLQATLKKEGYNISQYIKDPRFKIYKFIGEGEKARNYADTTQSWYMRRDSLEKCADFVEEYYSYLKRAEEKYGPSPEELVSQLELETNRGQFTGKYPVLNALISMYVNNEKRRKEFHIYLTDFLKLTKDTTAKVILPKDIFDITGSWAGAYGISQGMPSLIIKNGKHIDGDGDGKLNPMSIPDAIEFLAYELGQRGYKKNAKAAIQKYNPGDTYYASSIMKHTDALKKIVEKRRGIPPQKITYKTNNLRINMEPLKYNTLRDSGMTAMITQVPPQAQYKQPFIKRLISNLKIGKR
jgi:membrane-bound lytic murein transglycosylase B